MHGPGSCPSRSRIIARWSRTWRGCRARTNPAGSARSRNANFPRDRDGLIARRPRFEAPLLAKRINRLAEFILQYPHLVPAHIADRAFLDGFCADAPLAAERQEEIWRFLYSRPEMIALCHMNANIDNAWFWREPDGALRAGLIDWGSVGQMSVASSIWGCVGAAEPETHDRHLDELLDLFVAEYARAGGPVLDRQELAQHLELHVLMSALHMTTAPPAILPKCPIPESPPTATIRSSQQRNRARAIEDHRVRF